MGQPQICPVCGRTVTGPVVVTSDGVSVAHYTCEHGHGFSVWWKSGEY